MRVGSLFSGIGGLDLGLERAGMSVTWQCEIDPYCRAVLAHHWPGVKCYDDIRAIDDTAERVDLICGGFPCQPVSLAGKGLAQEDPRWLWPEFARVVGLLRPRYVLVENVPGLVRRGLSDVVGDLAALGYDAEWEIVSAVACGAPHLRERVFVVATHADSGSERGLSVDAEVSWAPQSVSDSDRTGQFEHGWASTVPAKQSAAQRSSTRLADSDEVGRDGWPRYFTEETWRRESQDGGWWETEPDVGRVAHGVPNRLAQLRALGNAVVPQVAEFVGRLILEAEGVARAA